MKWIDKGSYMNNKVGLWIDFKRAVIVINPNQEEEIKQIASRISDSSQNDAAKSQQVMSDDERAKALIEEQKRYYDEVISHLRTANKVLIIGPGKAKDELHKRLVIHGFDEQTVVIKTAKKMNEKQIIAEVHRHFL